MLTLALLHTLVPVLFTAPQEQAAGERKAPQQDRQVTCESSGTYKRCAANTSGMSVRIDRQLSKADCVQGRSWGFDPNGIWVNQGCRAVFAITNRSSDDNPGGGGGTRITCESSGGRRTCAANTTRGVRLTRQLSKATCQRNHTWGTERDYIWVDDGCRAEFALGGGGGGNEDHGRTVTCESPGGYRRCSARTKGQPVRLDRRLSQAECTQGRSWGYDENGIWVDRGCRAVFQIGRGDGQGGGEREEQVRCESRGGFLRCETPFARRGVRLVQQLSNAACTEDATWGYDRNAIWVDRGCRGIFEAGDPVANQGERVTCASDGSYYQCPADTNDGIRLIRQLSNAECRPGFSWGYDRGHIWVDRGCRAEFQAGGGFAAIRKQ